MCKLGALTVKQSSLRNQVGDGSLVGLCDYMNKHRSDVNPKWILQMTLDNITNEWTVVYRWDSRDC